MGEWKTVLLTLVVSVVTAWITGWITSKLSFRSDIKKYLHSKREVLYIEFYEELDKFLMNTSLIHDGEYTRRFFSFKPKFELIASKSVLKKYEPVREFFSHATNKLNDFNSGNDPFSIRPEDEVTTDMVIAYQGQLELFKKDNKPSLNHIQPLIDELTDAMRKDLGSK